MGAQVPIGYPGSPPYGIYVPAGLTCDGRPPTNNYTFPANQQPPFPGQWGIFSWQAVEGEWIPTADTRKGPNLLSFVLSFGDRFREGS